MATKGYISIEHLCTVYELKSDFFIALNDHELLELVIIEEVQYVHENEIDKLEKIVRLNRELDVNLEGIDVIFNLLKKVNEKDTYIRSLENKINSFDANDLSE